MSGNTSPIETIQSSISSAELTTALSNVTLCDDKTSSLQDSSPLKCPYEPGARLSLYHEDGRQLDATITKTFTGGADHPFSNSCTVQLRVLSSHRDLAFNTSQKLVLKIMDWRYSETVRSWFKCGPWDIQRRDELSTLPRNERHQFESWLYNNMHDSARANDYIEELCDCKLLPLKPTNIDFYARFITNSYNAETFSSQNLIPYPSTDAHKEVFLQRYADLQLAREFSIAETVQTYIPGFMPQVFGKVRVQLSSDDELDVSPQKVTESAVYGLLMEQIRGEPLATLQNASLDDAMVKRLMYRMMLFNLRLWRCNLELSDANLHNFILHYDSQNDTYQIKIVDYGGLITVAPNLDNPGYIETKLHGTLLRVQLRQEYYRIFFDVEGEALIVVPIISRLTSPDSTLHTERRDCFLECIDTLVVDFGHDLHVWHTIMLHILYAFDMAAFHKNADTVIKIVHDARRTMTEEHSRQCSEPWPQRAVARLANALGNKVEHAQVEMQRLVDMLGPQLENYNGISSLTSLNIVEGESRATLLFPDAEAMLRNYRDRNHSE